MMYGAFVLLGRVACSAKRIRWPGEFQSQQKQIKLKTLFKGFAFGGNAPLGYLKHFSFAWVLYACVLASITHL